MRYYSPYPKEIFFSLWKNRELIVSLVKRDIVGRYRGSFFGVFWSFLTPLIMLLVYSFVFGVVLKARWGVGDNHKLEFPLILFSGLMVFNLFSDCVSKSPNIILTNPNFVKKVIFPLEILPVVDILISLYHLAINLMLWIFAYIFLLGTPKATILYVPVIIFPECLLILGITWILASLGVFLRDICQIVGLATTVLMYLSPIFYPATSLPENYQWLFSINPLSLIIEQIRGALFYGTRPDFFEFFYYFVASLSVFLFGFAWFQKTRKGFADVL